MDWHTLSSSVVLEKLKTSEKGLAGEEIQHRQKTFGLNQLRALKKPSSIFRFLRQFNNILIYILLIAGVATLFLNHRVDSGVIFGVVIINAIIGFVQEGKAEKALEAIRHMLSPSATVIRDGERRTIQAVNLVPGDIVLLQSGDKVAADIRLIHNGEIIAQNTGTVLEYKNQATGYYRVEAYREGELWIASNPIYVSNSKSEVRNPKQI